MSKQIAQVNFRLPQSLKDQLEEAATINDRSTTSELINRLQASFDNEVKHGDVRDAYSEYNQAKLNLIDAINRDDLALRDKASLNMFGQP
ncbi:MAG: Arc family DNA-binding protein [Psychrobacter sp.]